MVFQQSKKEDGLSLLDEWLEWAQVCELDSFVELARQIKAHHSEIEATLTHKLNNARVESLNTKSVWSLEELLDFTLQKP